MKKIISLIASLLIASTAGASPIIPEATPYPEEHTITFSQYDATDKETPETGLTISGSECQISIAGGSYADCTGTITEIGLGDYDYELAAAELTTPGSGILWVQETASAVFKTKFKIIATADGSLQGTPSTTELQLAAAEAYGDDELNGAEIYIVSASTGAGQTACITDYVGSTDTATVQTLATAPTGTVRYRVVPGTNCASATSGDWTDGEKENIRSALGVDGTKTAASGGQLQTLDSIVDDILEDTGTTLNQLLVTIDGTADDILVDTGTTLPLAIANIDTDIANLNDLSAADVNQEVDTALGDYDAPTKAELDAGLAGLNDVSLSEVQDQAEAALETYRLDELVAIPAASAAAGSYLSDLLEDDGGTFRFTANALEEGPTIAAADDAADIYAYFTDLSRQDAFKANITGLATPTDVQTRMETVLTVTPRSELTSVPGSNPTILQMLQLDYHNVRNRKISSNSEETIFRLDNVTPLGDWAITNPTSTTTHRGQLTSP